MSTSLFPSKEYPPFLLEVIFNGPSFEGRMEIGALAKEIKGLEESLKIALHALKRHKRTDISLNDIEFFVEAFEKGSFKKRIRAFNKSTKEYQPLISLATLFILFLQTIAMFRPEELRSVSPQLMEQIRDKVIIELIQDKRFLSATADIVRSVSREGDKAIVVSPTSDLVEINAEQSQKFLQIAGDKEPQAEDGIRFEIVKGRVSRVDLDASKRHLGLKIDGEGSTVEATFLIKPTQDEMKALLGGWIEIKGDVEYVGGQRNHIDIKNTLPFINCQWI